MRCGGSALRVVVDTNVWVSGSIIPNSVPGRVLRLVRERRIEPVASWELVEEIARVLRSSKLRRYRLTQADVADVLALLSPFLPTVEFPASLRDPKDLMVVAAATGGGAEAIVTGDRDLLDDTALRRQLSDRGIAILTAKELLGRFDR